MLKWDVFYVKNALVKNKNNFFWFVHHFAKTHLEYIPHSSRSGPPNFAPIKKDKYCYSYLHFSVIFLF